MSVPYLTGSVLLTDPQALSSTLAVYMMLYSVNPSMLVVLCRSFSGLDLVPNYY